MGMDMRTRKTVVKEAAKRYRRARKKDKGRLLDEFVALTGYNRCYGARVLRGGERSRYQPTVRRCHRLGKRGRKRKYGPEVLGHLRKIWGILDFACGKRMVANMDEMICVLTRFKELDVSDEVRHLLLSISASTADRLLAGDRGHLELKGRSGTKPGSLLKHKIPICTFADWDDADVGFLQVDLVGHEGGNSRGDFCQSLSATDVATGWTEIRGLRNKAQVWTFEALKDVRAHLPFPLLGINSDTGGEFINDHLFRYCKAEKITFTRCRAGRKNDNCYVEQKNYTAVRQTVGYFRYDTDKELDLLKRIYSIWRLYANFFLPQMKLVDKIREGSKVRKRHDRPQTPYARILASRQVSKTVKARLRKQYATLNPAKLRRDMLKLQQSLHKLVASKRRHQITSSKSEEKMAHVATF
ncbi:MAG: hypothetical protein ABIJ00_12420 [Candidatus Eisenbacteria bacterium]